MRHGEQRRLSDRAFAAVAGALAFLSYFAVFVSTREGGVIGAAEASMRNFIPLAVLSAGAHAIICRYLLGSSFLRQLAGHVALGTAFTILLYWLLMVLIGVSEGDSFTEFVVKAFFPSGAVAWQLLQGLTLYALVACLTYLRSRPAPAHFTLAPQSLETAQPKDQSPSRYFIKKGEDIHPIEVSQIVSIRGADDYAEVATLQGRHLVRMTLTEFERTLEGDNFLRVHRSHIVNTDRIARAEPAGGGRMLLHMEDGEMIAASRTGSRLLKDRVI